MIIRNTNNFITKNFKESEFYSTSPDRPAEHYLNDNLPEIVQHIRDVVGVPIKITSSFRTSAHQYSLFLAGLTSTTKSTHTDGDAIDCKLLQSSEEHLTWIQNQIFERGPFYDDLYALGLRGFGYYDTFIHLDCREGSEFKTWDNRSKAVKERRSQGTTFAPQNFSEDGSHRNPELKSRLLAIGLVYAVFKYL
ncbi:D-Ala-D-Ala carboxypeptidase family metallohydrolase [Sanyastnella coralliicola]|uniref:D-Ala-D-Ala carboxypeptidase family metallohydrolase n=1 Tax=Sanyastnella coralliicola TaxID=3069118 RepID=UPI0027B9C3D5|nr:D-Ala-D-Ala carboxypeptidase family metallohydrolase [Longitalea sp. SCSIO 12813]